MDKNFINEEAIRDAHLDTLIRLVYKQAELEEIQKLVTEEDKPLPEDLEALKYKTYSTFEEKRRRVACKAKRAACKK